MEYTRESIRLFAQSYKLISIYKGILDNPVGKSLTAFLDLLAETNDPDERLIAAYCDFFSVLAAARSDVSLPAFFIERILEDVNAFTTNPVAASNYVSDAILTDLECIQAICTIKAEALRDYLRSLYILTAHEEYLPLVSRLPLFFNEVNNLDNIAKQDGSLKSWHLIYKSLVFALEQPEAFVAMLPRLRKFHETNGCGLFCRYPAVYFDGELHALPKEYYPIDHEFFDYNGMCVKLIENTARFIVHGERHNALLSGPGRLGKTTTLRLLPEQFTNAGYRYLELCYREDWDVAVFERLQSLLRTTASGNLKIVLALLRIGACSKERFYDPRLLLFSNMQKYALPSNCLIYGSYDGTLEELQAKWPELAKHFPLQLEFRLPNQEEYLASVFAFSNLAGFDVDDPNLTQAALTYAKQRQAHDLDVARDFIEVWRFMQEDKLTLTYDKVNLQEKSASDSLSTPSESTDGETADINAAAEAASGAQGAEVASGNAVAEVAETEAEIKNDANVVADEIHSDESVADRLDDTDRTNGTTVDGVAVNAGDISVLADSSKQISSDSDSKSGMFATDVFSAAAPVVLDSEVFAAGTDTDSVAEIPATDISAADVAAASVSASEVKPAYYSPVSEFTQAVQAGTHDNAETLKVLSEQLANDKDDDLSAKLDKLASELTAFHKDKVDYLNFGNWEFVDDFSKKSSKSE